MQACSKCKSEKPDEAFARNKASASGFHSYCRECMAAYARDRDPAKKKANNDRWVKANPDKVAAKARRSYERHRKKRIAVAVVRVAAWRAANPEKRKALARQNYRNHKAYYHAKVAERRALQRNAIPKWADLEEIKTIYAEAGRLNAEGKQVHVDHVVPLKHPLVCGLHTPANLEIISAQANWSKNNRHWPDMPDLC